ncbi:OmpH family outer membrane protein [Deferribacter autotrophicus]|uniref:OmpH family outer membrane protein n=1 Tax=Deferribacter autotrophicus TaxID=500465 RepID=A0A5A8F3W9_9BACT|nr:OmpH family outer membrane protein [Deferribacter autotrophicus]KAA0257733.1 OmpH family outer membrane protein [Deferribacter autotrophicus]
MKRKITLFVVAMFLFGAFSAFAELKIGVVNMQRALDECDAGKAAVEEMKKIYNEKQQEINEKQNELKKMQEEINNQSSLLSDEAKQAKLDEYQKKLKELKRFVADSNEELKKKEKEYIARIANDLRKVVEALGKELKYDVILEIREAGVMYNSNKVDITNLVIERYNKEWHARQK